MPLRFAYQFLLYVSAVILRILSVFLPGEAKLNRLLSGRKNTVERLKKLPPKQKKRVWAHAASLGEFDMLRPLLRKLEQQNDIEIAVSFFSPSGFEHVEMPSHWMRLYMLHDTPSAARFFIKKLQPNLVIFAKYEFWLSHLRILNQNQIPFLYWNTALRASHFLIQPWAYSWRNALEKALLFACQNKETQRILNGILPLTPNLLTGDMRFLQTAQVRDLPGIFTDKEVAQWQEKRNIVWGSAWQEELEVLTQVIPLNTGDYRFVLAPHDVSEKNLSHIESQLPGQTQRLSQWLQNPIPEMVVLVDGIGKLKYIYRYASVAIVGGGFTNALHNIIEPLSLGVPVLFGSNHAKFPEAQEAINAKAALHADTPKELTDILTFLLFHRGNAQLIRFHQNQARAFFDSNTPNLDVVLPYCTAALTK